MEGIALHVGAGDRGVEEAQIEGGIVADEDRAPALVGAHRVADLAEDSLQRVAFGQRRAQRMVRIDAGDRQRRRIEARAREGLHVVVVGGTAAQRAVGVHVDEHRRNLQQRVGRGVKAAALHIDHHRQVAAEAPRHERRQPGRARPPARPAQRRAAVRSCGDSKHSAISETPADTLAGAQRHQLVGAERVVRRHLPGLRQQGKGVACCAADRRSRRRGRRRTPRAARARRPREGLRVQLDAGVRGEDPGAATGRSPWPRARAARCRCRGTVAGCRGPPPRAARRGRASALSTGRQ